MKILINTLKFLSTSEMLELLLQTLVLENQCKIVVPLFGAAYAAPNKGTTIF